MRIKRIVVQIMNFHLVTIYFPVTHWRNKESNYGEKA